MPLAHAVCSRIAVELAGTVPVDDLLSAAAFGLMEAIERYDPGMGAQFETYCAVRIRGAVLDELRYLHTVPRIRTTRNDRIAADRSAPRSPHRPEGAGATPRRTRSCISLSASHTEHEDVRQVDIIEARDVCDPAVLLQEKERRDLLAREVRRLPAAERLLVMLYYFDELTMKQIGQLLNVTESRVCQMHAGILERLQQRLAERDESRPSRVFIPTQRREQAPAEVADV